MPKLPLDELTTQRENIEPPEQTMYEEAYFEEEVPLKKPAILSDVGTSTTVSFHQRKKPTEKVSFLKSIQKRNASM